MKVAMIANTDHNLNSGVSGTRLAIADALRNLGVHVDTYFMDDLKVFQGGILDKLIFPGDSLPNGRNGGRMMCLISLRATAGYCLISINVRRLSQAVMVLSIWRMRKCWRRTGWVI